MRVIGKLGDFYYTAFALIMITELSDYGVKIKIKVINDSGIDFAQLHKILTLNMRQFICLCVLVWEFRV